MSIYQFPNATNDKVDKLISLTEKLLINPPSDQKKAEDIIELIGNAYRCSAIEALIRSLELQGLYKLDPKTLRDIKFALDDCR